jgi:hypothetical protein
MGGQPRGRLELEWPSRWAPEALRDWAGDVVGNAVVSAAVLDRMVNADGALPEGLVLTDEGDEIVVGLINAVGQVSRQGSDATPTSTRRARGTRAEPSPLVIAASAR